MTLKQRINTAEQGYKNEVLNIAKKIADNKNIRLILIAGPSCSGKTTTSATLSKYLNKLAGKNAYTISIDDFYKDVTFAPGETFKDKDFEALDSIDMELLHSVLHDLSIGKEADIPLFDFEKTRRDGIRSTITLTDNDIAIIEGLHALNPKIYEGFVDKDKIVKIFLDCFDGNDENKLERFLRRLVRDRNFRNADANLTFTLWSKVISGEEKHIYPYAKFADYSINTYHNYEGDLLKPSAEKLLAEITEGSEFFDDAKIVSEYLEVFNEDISPSLIPKDSLLREFIG